MRSPRHSRLVSCLWCWAQCSGRLELLHEGRWKAICARCYDRFLHENAERQTLGYTQDKLYVLRGWEDKKTSTDLTADLSRQPVLFGETQ
jgi:hypothetical protein